LRNVATRNTFFHNGIYHTLKQVMDFYVQRDTNPEKFYLRNADGSVRKFDDLPTQYQGNVNLDPPFDRKLGDKPALTDQENEDIIAFLGTLTDGYHPQ
jgi:cytochrome c peroxidase